MFELPPERTPLLLTEIAEPEPPAKPKAKRKRKEIKFLTEDEIARLFSAIHSVRDRAIFQLAYRAGLRASEIGMLQLRDYDPKTAKIFVHCCATHLLSKASASNGSRIGSATRTFNRPWNTPR